MMFQIKNWRVFQHYQSGRGSPPWIKLYRSLIDDIEWFNLDPKASKFLINCLILAAENEGYLPDIKVLAFRLRIDIKECEKFISQCSNWIITDASKMLASCNQVAIPETETETEKKRKSEFSDCFIKFWNAWPSHFRKGGKGECWKLWKQRKLDSESDSIIAHVEYCKGNGVWKDVQFIPAPKVYLNQSRWDGSETSETKTFNLKEFMKKI